MRAASMFVAATLVGCGFQHGALPSSGDDAGSPGDAAVDAFEATMIYGSSGNDLHAIDVATMQVQRVGRMNAPDGTALWIDALGFGEDGQLVAVSASNQYLITIERTTARVLTAVPVPDVHTFWGATVAPPGELGTGVTVLLAANDTATLYEVRADGSLRTIGPFGNGLKVAGDIAWVKGDGLYASVTAPTCSGTCIARVASNGQATLLATTGPSDLWSLSAFGGELYAVGGSGTVYRVNRTTGATVSMFQLSGLSLTDAAP